LTNPPKALLKARMDNIAIVPASMLPLTQTLKEKVNSLPKGGVFLCYAKENSRQKKINELPRSKLRGIKPPLADSYNPPVWRGGGSHSLRMSSLSFVYTLEQS
jgi:hypothetical protein